MLTYRVSGSSGCMMTTCVSRFTSSVIGFQVCPPSRLFIKPPISTVAYSVSGSRGWKAKETSRGSWGGGGKHQYLEPSVFRKVSTRSQRSPSGARKTSAGHVPAYTG
ncbi:MAG: hypothetical protein QGG90_00885 [Nitrospinota bacterium]|nr:hypothetical protein [Nitrospinota bacterium]